MFGFKKDLKKYNLPKEELAKFNYAKITTDKGIIWIKLFKDETPTAVSNFANSSWGKSYFFKSFLNPNILIL